MRFRDDKPQGNHRKVVEGIIQSIADGVEKDDVSIPMAWPLSRCFDANVVSRFLLNVASC